MKHSGKLSDINPGFMPAASFGTKPNPYGLPSSIVFSALNHHNKSIAVNTCKNILEWNDKMIHMHHAEEILDGIDIGNENSLCSINVLAFGGTALAVNKFVRKVRRISSSSLADTHRCNNSHIYMNESIMVYNKFYTRLLLSTMKQIAISYIAANYGYLDINGKYFTVNYNVISANAVSCNVSKMVISNQTFDTLFSSTQILNIEIYKLNKTSLTAHYYTIRSLLEGHQVVDAINYLVSLLKFMHDSPNVLVGCNTSICAITVKNEVDAYIYFPMVLSLLG